MANKFNEITDKVVGEVKEMAGKLTNNEGLELKGKLQKGLGKAREVAGDVVHEIEDVKDTVFGSAKETVGKLTDNRTLELKGKFQKRKARGGITNKIIYGTGAVIGVLIIGGAIKKIVDKNITTETN